MIDKIIDWLERIPNWASMSILIIGTWLGIFGFAFICWSISIALK